MYSWIQTLPVVAACALAAVTDARTGRIPNLITLPMLLGGPVVGLAQGGALGGLSALGGLVVCGAVPMLLFWRGGMGGGDVKLFAALGAWLGPGVGLEVELVSMMVVALEALVLLAWRGTLLATLGSSAALCARGLGLGGAVRGPESAPGETLRMGVGIFLALLLCLFVLPLVEGRAP